MPREHLLTNEALRMGPVPSRCIQCGRETFFEWYLISLCSIECLEALAEEWGAEMLDEQDELAERLEAAPRVPDWWPRPIYELTG